ncbi:peroxiredoxin [Sphingobium sp. B2D3A]|uniref:TlpA family protein disulfide reductase n=1 Tax=unclassified Sphingobium TaxID=2611147 RepID=UPI002224A9AE|nr:MULTISPECIES: TlpA disulfide reductase family protein [unclassified Sphingobium]MCW2337431.1 peroxiredoxin [Sphingobium sp. B2D3A]MCW2383889.1 peroxiredoxin [Sphingobium sp. B2D3D]MCW2393440.1 peroxiredoxin [Sphingobium sp. B11D3A]MCW2405377.1 peroxiredoxin [Sphingobium sp. B1D7B]
MRSKFAAVAALIAIIGMSVARPAHGQKIKVGDLAPAFTLMLADGSSVSLADLKGQVVVLNFWATWCGPCIKELPTLDAFHDILKDKGLRVFAVATEDSVPLPKLKKMLAGMTIPMVRRVKGPYRHLGALPTNFVIGRDGRVRYAATGAFDLDQLNRVIIPLMNERAPTAPARSR